MTENDFWKYMKKLWEKEGRVDQLSGYIDSSDLAFHAAGKYAGGHSILPNNYAEVPDKVISAMSNLLSKKKVKPATKEAILIVLAHHGSDAALTAVNTYNKNLDRRLKYFHQMALDECQTWYDD